MEVNFNELRRDIIRDYNNLVKKATNVDKVSEESYEALRANLKAMRDSLVILACCYDDEAGIVSLANEQILVAP